MGSGFVSDSEVNRPEELKEKLRLTHCVACDNVGSLELEWRKILKASPLGSFSLSGVEMKTTAERVDWPYIVCRTEQGGCGRESAGKRA